MAQTLNPIRIKKIVEHCLLAMGLIGFVVAGSKAIATANDHRYVDGFKRQTNLPQTTVAKSISAPSKELLNYSRAINNNSRKPDQTKIDLKVHDQQQDALTPAKLNKPPQFN